MRDYFVVSLRHDEEGNIPAKFEGVLSEGELKVFLGRYSKQRGVDLIILGRDGEVVIVTNSGETKDGEGVFTLRWGLAHRFTRVLEKELADEVMERFSSLREIKRRMFDEGNNV